MDFSCFQIYFLKQIRKKKDPVHHKGEKRKQKPQDDEKESFADITWKFKHLEKL